VRLAAGVGRTGWFAVPGEASAGQVKVAGLGVWSYSLPLQTPDKRNHMKAFFSCFICRLVMLSTIVLPYSAHTQAALIGTEQAVARVQAQSERDKVRSFVARADVQNQLAGLGLSAAGASERVNALTDDEVQQLAGKIDSLPAGADAGVVTVLLVIVLVLVIFYLLDNKRWR